MTFATRLALCFAAMILTGSRQSQPPLSLFLAKMRARSGPVWSAHILSATGLPKDSAGAIVRNDTRGLRSITQRCEGALCDGTYFDGTRLYAVDINGTALPHPPGIDAALLRSERIVSSLAFLAPGFRERRGTIRDEGSTLVRGQPYRVLQVSDNGAIPMTLFVDPTTGTLRYARDASGNTTFTYLDYRPVGAYRLPFLILRDDAVLERYQERRIVSTPFAPPHGPALSFDHRPVTLATDPQESIPVFACSLAGIATHCLLDSGNSGLSMSLQLAERLNAPAIGAFRIQGLGAYATEVVRGGILRAGGLTLQSADYVVLHDIHRYGYDVVLGCDMFATTPIDIDGAKHRVTFGAQPPVGATAIPLTFSHFVPTVRVELGATPATLTLDTGDESTINLAYDFYAQHPSLFAVKELRPVSGVGGESVEMTGTIPDIRLGSLAVSNQTIGATQHLQGTPYGHLGAGFLQEFNTLIDYPSSTLYLDPSTATPSPAPVDSRR
jgi:hypothetical protein